MGKYSNVNANNLLNAVNTALTELNSYNLQEINNDINNGNILNSSAKNVIDQSIDKIRTSKNLNGSIPNLKEKLKNLKSAANHIIKYQELEEEIEDLESRKYTTKYNFATKERERTLNSSVVNRLNSKNQSLKNYEILIDNLLK